jgi:glutamyl-tRNA reductase
MELCIVGLNHRTTPVEFRERFALPPDQVPAVLPQLRDALGLSEVLVLSTCNRLEVYCVSSNGPLAAEDVFKVLAAAKGGTSFTNFEQLLPCLVVHRGEACIRHLFRVASSLDSLVVGETEIVGQVKKAYQIAQSSGATGKVLNRLFQKALSTSKEVRTRSGIGRCSTSVGSVALDLANKVFGEDLSDRTILIVGAGKMGETTLKHLSKHGAGAILVTNRSYDRALDLVSRFQGTAVPFEELPAALASTDIVVSSTSAPNYVLDASMISAAMARRPDRPMLLVDLAVPRDIDPAALKVNSVYLYNIDQLAELARLNMERRQTEAAACEKLVAGHALEAATVLSSNTVSATRSSLRSPLPLLPQFAPA